MRIIKFTTHSYKEKVFLQHKQNKKVDNGKKKKNSKRNSQVRLNVQPSLSRNGIELFRKANEAIAGNGNFKFAYADMHGNLKLILNKLLNIKYVKHFRSEEDIVNIISLPVSRTVSTMEGGLAVVRNVNTLFLRQLDEADSYSRRSYMIVTGLGKPGNDEANREDGLNVISAVAKKPGIDENDFRKHDDKIHPIGGTENRNQVRIIKFTAHNYKEKVFLQHKRNKKIDNGKKKKNPKHKSQVWLNVQPSLSRNGIELFRKANESIEGNENFKFAYADMHGNLKFILNKPLNMKYVKHFRSEEDIFHIISA